MSILLLDKTEPQSQQIGVTIKPKRLPLDAWWKLCLLVVFSLIGIASQYVEGQGVHSKLNVSEGVGSAAFNASMQFRYNELSEPQLANLNWALEQLPGNELQNRYGNHPTVRSVVLGELMRAADPLYITTISTFVTKEQRQEAAKAMKTILDARAWF